MLAIKSKNFQVARALVVEKEVRVSYGMLYSNDMMSWTNLIELCFPYQYYFVCIQVLLEEQNSRGETALTLLVKGMNRGAENLPERSAAESLVCTMTKQGVSVNRGNVKFTPLTISVSNQAEKAVKCLLDAGAEINIGVCHNSLRDCSFLFYCMRPHVSALQIFKCHCGMHIRILAIMPLR